MLRPYWRYGSGFLACFVWMSTVGLPVAIFHGTSERLGVGHHIHSAILFAASLFLIFWMFARPSRDVEEAVDAEIVTFDDDLTPFRQDEP